MNILEIINDPIAKKTLDVLPTRRVEYLEHYFLKFSYKNKYKKALEMTEENISNEVDGYY